MRHSVKADLVNTGKHSPGNNNAASGRLGVLRADDAVVYMFLAFLIIGSTLGYTSTDAWYLVVTGFGSILSIAAIFLKKYTYREICVAGSAFAVSALVALATHSLTLLLTTVVLVSSKGMKISSLLSFFFFVTLR